MEYILMNEEYPFVEWDDQFLTEYTIFCESEDNLTDDNVTDDIEESAPGLYEQWLKLNGYDPKTNTIGTGYRVDIGNNAEYRKDPTYDPKTNTVLTTFSRANVGKMGSNKERNRRNQFLKRHGFDPITGTYQSDIKLADGSRARIPIALGADNTVGNSGSISGANFASHGSYDKSLTSEIKNPELWQTDEQPYEYYKTELEDLNDSISDTKHRLSDPELPDWKREQLQRILSSRSAERKDVIKQLKSNKINRGELAKKQQDALRLKTKLNLRADDPMKKPKQADYVTKHEEGHGNVCLNIDRGSMNDKYHRNVSFPGYNRNAAESIMHSPAQDKQNKIIYDKDGNPVETLKRMSKHDWDNEEHYADTYGVKHNKFIKSKQDAMDTLENYLNNATGTFKKNFIKNSKNKVKRATKELEKARTNTTEKRFWNDSNFWDAAKKLQKAEKELADTQKYVKDHPGNRELEHHSRARVLDSQIKDSDFDANKKKKQKNYKEYMI